MSPGKSPFSHFALSETDIEQLHELARALVASNLADHEKFLRAKREKEAKQVPVIDETAWKFVREREKMRAYICRTKNSTETSWMSTIPGERGSAQPVSPTRSRDSFMEPELDHLAVMLVVGTVAGTMEDMMYGLITSTADESLIKTSYVKDTESGVAVLATLEAPTLEDPFRSIMIKYVEIEQPRFVRTMVKKRNYVFMEITGIANLPNNGERIGYHILHSVHFPQTPEFASAVRGSLSVSTFSQLKPDTTNEVEVCVRGLSDPGGNIIRAVASSSMSAALCSTARNVDCANMKKLAWLVRCSSKKPRNLNDASRGCVTCNKAPLRGKLGDLVNNSRKCHVCWGYVCSSCRVKNKLSFIRAPTGKLVRRELPFCSACVKSAVTMSAFTVAQQEIAAEAGSESVYSDFSDVGFFSFSSSDYMSECS